MHIPPTVPTDELLTAVLGASTDLVVMVDVNGIIHDVAGTGDVSVLGRAREDWIGASLLTHVHPDDRTSVVDRLADIWAGAEDPRPNVAFRAAHAGGFWLSLEITGGRSVASSTGRGIVIVMRDVTQRADAERRLRETCRELDFVVSHDALTGLPNRAILHARLEAVIGHLRPTDHSTYAIMVKVLDLDGLRELHGVAAMTSILHGFASTVRSQFDQAEFVGADGIGEIVALTRPDRTASEVEQLANGLHRLANSGSTAAGGGTDLQVSIGVLALRPGCTAEETIADVARAAALGRRSGTERTIHFEQPRPAEADLGCHPDDVGAALAAGELELWYQPIISTRSDRLHGFEGLLRWIHPEDGVRTASEFLPAVQNSAAMLDLGEFVMAEGCRQLASWQRDHADGDAPSLALNVSGWQVRQGDFIDRVLHHLDESGADPSGLCLELTDTHAIGGDSDAAARLEVLRARGMRLGLDDFGTGHSSLHHLRHIRADVLKIDRTFVERLGADPGATAIVRASVEMGAAFGLFTVAEGVTTSAQRQLLQTMGCDAIQGYLIGPAIPIALADAFLRDVRSSNGRPTAQTLIDIERHRGALSTVDDAYRPGHDEIAAAAGVSAHDVRAGSTPPRFELVDDDLGCDRQRARDHREGGRSAQLDDAGPGGDDHGFEL